MQELYSYSVPYFPSQLVRVQSSNKGINKLIHLDGSNRPGGIINVSLEYLDNAQIIDTKNKKWRRFGFCYVSDEENMVYFCFPAGPFRFKMLIKNMDSYSPQFIVNKSYESLPVAIGTSSQFYENMKDVLYMLLIKAGYLSIHGACLITPKGEAAIIIGPSETGKTITTLLGSDKGYIVASDDRVIIKDESVYPTLVRGQKLWSGAYLNTLKGMSASIKRAEVKMIHWAGLEGYTNILQNIAGTLIQKDTATTAKLKYIFIIERGLKQDTGYLTDSEILTRIRYIQLTEFYWRSNPRIVAYDYYTRKLNIASLQSREDELLEKLVTSDVSCIHVTSDHPAYFINAIKDYLPV